jgi:ABC-type siderophore export system fused ATPase/permease subunit
LNSQVQDLKNEIRMVQSRVLATKNVPDKPYPANDEVLQSLEIKIDRITADTNKLKNFSFNKIAENFEHTTNQFNFLKYLITVVLIICLFCFCIVIYLGLDVYSMNKKLHILQNTLENTLIENNNKIINKMQELKINSEARPDIANQIITTKPGTNSRNEKNYK